MDFLTGEFKNTLDEKGRLSLPARFRNALPGNTLILTQGVEGCLWLYPPEEWEGLLKVIMGSTSPFSAHSRLIRRRIIGPAQETEIDKAGRIAVPQSLREFAGLSRDCIILGLSDYIEIWDADRQRSYLEANEEEFVAGFEELALRRQQEKELSAREGT
jgi:MraZ protein